MEEINGMKNFAVEIGNLPNLNAAKNAFLAEPQN